MHKPFTLIIFLLAGLLVTAQEDVLIIFEQQEVTASDSLHITMFLDRDQEVEVAVFTMEKLFVAERSKLSAGRIDYVLPLTGIWPAKFVLLLAGESFHEEFEFLVRE